MDFNKKAKILTDYLGFGYEPYFNSFANWEGEPLNEVDNNNFKRFLHVIEEEIRSDIKQELEDKTFFIYDEYGNKIEVIKFEDLNINGI